MKRMVLVLAAFTIAVSVALADEGIPVHLKGSVVDIETGGPLVAVEVVLIPKAEETGLIGVLGMSDHSGNLDLAFRWTPDRGQSADRHDSENVALVLEFRRASYIPRRVILSVSGSELKAESTLELVLNTVSLRRDIVRYP